MTFYQAIVEVSNHRLARIAKPGKWRVWRDGDIVKHEVQSK